MKVVFQSMSWKNWAIQDKVKIDQLDYIYVCIWTKSRQPMFKISDNFYYVRIKTPYVYTTDGI